MTSRPLRIHRRPALLAMLALLWRPRVTKAQDARHPQHRWFEIAEAMRQRALSWGDQSYGAVVVLGDTLAGEGPSRVVRDSNPDAHAERVAIADAQRRLQRNDLGGAVLYSTSRPCADCERAAARAGVARMFVGADLVDAGPPLQTRPNLAR